MVFLRKSFLIFSAFLLISPPVDALNLDDFGEKENISSTGVVVDISEPVIESISIEEYQENEGVVLSVKGKNFIPPHGKAVLLFPNDTGGTTSVTSFLYESPTHLVFPIPKNPSSGNVYVEAQETKGEKQKKQSNAFYFEFHPPEILFITGENGIAPGKDIRIWGKNLDGVYYQKGGRSYVVEDVSTGQLTGGFSKKAEEGLSYIDVTLPEENFNKKFWVERGCDRDGKNCLKSNKIQLTNTFPPVLTEYQLNFQTRIVTAYGKYLPEEAKDLSLSYEGKTLSIIDYDGTEGKFSFQLPCPMSGRGTLKVRSGGIWSNPLFISTPDVPELFGLSVEYSFHDGYRKVNVSARGDLLNVPTSTVCSEDAILYLGNTGFPLEKFGGAYFNDMLDDSYIPSSGEASVVFRGIRSEKIPFEKESFSVKPYIYQVESKYGFRPGAPFQIFGRNLGNKYKSCDQGSTIFTGPKIYSEERTKDGDCVPIRPMVSDSRIDAQFAPLEYGEYSSSSKKTTVSVSVGGKKSNEVDILFGMNEQKVSYAKPIITSVEYPEGHLPGSQVILRGGGFGIKTIYNIISFAGKAITPESTNSRGTELSFRIPEGAFSGKLVVTRKTPDEQQSEGVDILVSPHEEKKVLFSFAGEGKESVIEVDGAEETVQFANISVMNSISDIAVRRMRFDFSFTDGDPDHSLSYKSLKVLPFGTFTLKHNKKAVSSPIVATSAGNGHFFLDFPEFTLPLTEGDSDTISIETTILPFVTDKSAFSLSFDPDSPSRVSLYSEELGQGIALSPQETIALPSFSVSQSDTKTCIDTLSDNSHCEQYESLKKRNTSWQEKVQQEKQEQKNTEKQITKERQEKDIKEEIQRKQRLAAEQRSEKILQNRIETKKFAQKGKIEALLEKEEQKMIRLQKNLSPEHAKKAVAALEKKIQALRMVLEQQQIRGSKDIEKAFEEKKQQEKQQKLQAILLQKNLTIAERLQKGARIDTDRDGLSDAEEFLLQTDPDRSDTDHDGYSDFSEVEFGFPPLKRETAKIYSDISSAGKSLAAISRFALMGLFPEKEDTFNPSTKATKAEFVGLLMEVFANMKDFSYQKLPFSDVSSDDWFAPAVRAAFSLNVISGDEKYFRPLEYVSRLEACSLVLSASGTPPISFLKNEKIPFEDISFSDVATAITCSEKNILDIEEPEQVASTEEVPESEKILPSFEPQKEVTRAEMALMIYRAIFVAE